MSKEEIEEALDLVDKFIFSRDKAVGFLPDRTKIDICKWITAFTSLVNCSLCFNDWGKLELIREVLQSALETPNIPEGWQIVPKEPTIRMVNAGINRAAEGEIYLIYSDIYKAMLSAAPEPPVSSTANEGENHGN